MRVINIERFTIWIGPLLLLLAWITVSSAHVVSPTLLPGIVSTFAKLYGIVLDGSLFPNLGSTLMRAVVGFMLSVALGVPIGVYLGAHPRIYRMFDSVIEFFRSLPGTAMFPLFLLAFGIGDGSKIAIAWFISFWIILVNSAYGVLQGSKTRTKVAESLRATPWQTLSRVIFMDALPQIFIGLRIGLSLSLIAVVVSEMFIGSNTGLGQKIYDSYLTYEISYLYAWLIVTGIVGYILNTLFAAVEHKTIHWVGK
jgi:ABC-type nitrate/sulfonate/bicarbonate transport system permease component